MQTLIIGRGLSGLAVAEALEANGDDYMLLEARDRTGGRIITEYHGSGYFDLGPAWFWPGQPRMAELVARLGLEKFDQYSQGASTFEDAQGQVQHGRGFASMEGSWRLVDGLQALTKGLADRLPESRLRLNAEVTSLSQTEKAITATLSNGAKVGASQVVLAMPPRIAAKMSFSPSLPANAVQSMRDVRTWMAGQAKALAVYDRPFWREAGLSGDATSRLGPMVEIHDASPASGGPYGLFGFIGLPPHGRVDEQALRHDVIAQIVRLFGPDGAQPAKLYLKDWAYDPNTSAQVDLEPLHAHPDYEMPQSFEGLWDNKLLFAGTEVAAEFGGYLEGALGAAANVLTTLRNRRSGREHAR